MFLKPQRKKNHLASRFNKRVVLNIPVTRIQELYTNEIRLYIADNDYAEKEIQRYDDIGRETVLKNNTIWFKNNLSEDQINEYFRNNVETSAISVMIQEPYLKKLMFEGRTVANFGELIAVAYRNGGPVSLWANVKIEIQGLVFYQKMFGVRWVLCEIDILKEDPREIDRAWIETEAQDFRQEIEDEWINKGRQRIGEIENLLVKLKEKSSMNAEWNALIQELRRKL